MAVDVNKRLIIYEELCSKEEERKRREQGRVSRWEKECLVAEFTRQDKIQVRSPQAMYRTLEYLLIKVCRLSSSPSPTTELFSPDWGDIFQFISDRLSGVKQEFIISSLPSKHISILQTIVDFYLLSLLSPTSPQHKCYSEAYSTVCFAVQLWYTEHNSYHRLPTRLFIYHFLLNLGDICVLNRLLGGSRDLAAYPVSKCLEIYFSYVSCNFDRFGRLWAGLEPLERAALSEHAKKLWGRAGRVISVGYKSKNLRYPVEKFMRYTCTESVEKFGVDEKGINFSKFVEVEESGKQATADCSRTRHLLCSAEVGTGFSFSFEKSSFSISSHCR